MYHYSDTLHTEQRTKKNHPERVRFDYISSHLYLNGMILKNYYLTGGRYKQNMSAKKYH